MKRFLTVFCVCFAAASCLGVCLAVEVPAVTPLEFEGEAASAIWTILAGQGVWGALLFAMIGLLWKFGKPYLEAKAAQHRLDTLMLAAESAVHSVTATYVEAVKAASADGKLTKEEAATAREMARSAMAAFMQTQGIDLMKDYSKEVLDCLIEYVLAKIGITAKAVQSVIAPLPDLGPSAPSV